MEEEKKNVEIDKKYKLGSIIGKGSVSTIYEDDENDDEVYKLCNKEYYDEQNLQMELSLIDKLKNIKDIYKYIMLPYSVEESGNNIVFKYKRAELNMFEYFHKKFVITDDNYLIISYILVYALGILHKNDIIHCDIKLENILIVIYDKDNKKCNKTINLDNTLDFYINLCDLNLAMYSNTLVNDILCTVTTRPPEWHYINKLNKVNKKSDIYSVGLVLIEILFIRGVWYHIDIVKEYKKEEKKDWEDIYKLIIPNALYTDRREEWSKMATNDKDKIDILSDKEEFPLGWLKDYILENRIYVNRNITERILKFIDRMLDIEIENRPDCTEILKFLCPLVQEINVVNNINAF